MRNTLDGLIKQLGTETELIPATEEPLENIIFNPKIFNTPEKLIKLKEAISAFISDNPVKDEKKIDARTKNQFFYLYAALWSLPNVLANDSMASFIRQMAMWVPEWISSDKKEERKYEQSFSNIKKKWEQKGILLKVTEWKSFIKRSSMSIKKAMYFESLAMKIYTDINLLVKGILREKH